MSDTTAPTITISLQEYEQLVWSQDLLRYLESSGVHNWGLYEDVLARYYEEHPERE